MEMSQVEKGVQFSIQIKKNWYTGTILDFRYSSDGNYYQCKCELEAEAQNPFTGEAIKQKWIHPQPIQSYKLRRIGGPTVPRQHSMSDSDIINQMKATMEN